jgi:hypothetical protein
MADNTEGVRRVLETVALPKEPPKTNPSPLAAQIMATGQNQMDMIRQMGGSPEMAAQSKAMTDRALAAVAANPNARLIGAETRPLTSAIAADRVLSNPSPTAAAALAKPLTKPLVKPVSPVLGDRSALRQRRIQGQLALRGLGTVIRG